jgi:hypothetical protein
MHEEANPQGMYLLPQFGYHEQWDDAYLIHGIVCKIASSRVVW